MPSGRDLYWQQRREVPAFRALMRAMEARFLAELGPLPRPALDVGCGDGQFATTVWGSGRGRLEAGVDFDETMLAEARERGAYDAVVRADAVRLPFPEASFGSVVCNSVLEHLPPLEAVLSEMGRVLRPGGLLAVTVPTDRLNDGLAGYRLLRAIGAAGAARRYQAWFTRVQRHHHMYSPEEWQRRIEEAGFRVTRRTGYFPRGASTWFDPLHAWGVPDLVTRRLLGRWVLCPWRPAFRLEERLLAGYVTQTDPEVAGCCFLVAERA